MNRLLAIAGTAAALFTTIAATPSLAEATHGPGVPLISAGQDANNNLDPALDNLTVIGIRCPPPRLCIMSGYSLSTDPVLPSGTKGVFFTYDPDKHELAEKFMVGGVQKQTVDNWRDVRFRSNSGRTHLHVLWGNPDNPQGSMLIAELHPRGERH